MASSAREPQRCSRAAAAGEGGRGGARGKTLPGDRWAWNGAAPSKTRSGSWEAKRQCLGTLHPVPFHKLVARQALREAHRLSTPPRGLASGGNLGGAEHAVRNNLGGMIFFLLGSVKSLIYGFLSGPGLQIIPLSKQPNS